MQLSLKHTCRGGIARAEGGSVAILAQASLYCIAHCTLYCTQPICRHFRAREGGGKRGGRPPRGGGPPPPPPSPHVCFKFSCSPPSWGDRL